MKKGDCVNVYFDPFTEQNLEAVVQLIKLVREDDTFQYWFVRFNSTSGKYIRKIKRDGIQNDFHC